MREFDMDLTKYLAAGLLPREIQQTRAEGLSVCENLVVTPQGLIRRPDIADMTGTTLRPIGTITDAYEVLDFHLFQAVITESGVREFLLDPALDTYTEITPVTPSYPAFTTGCSYNESQAVCALGEEIYWSKIGMFDFTVDNSNEAGHMPVPFSGTITRVMQLGNRVAIFGERGVCLLEPIVDPVPAWKLVRIPRFDRIGLHSYDAVCRVDEGIVFVGSNYELYRLTFDGQVQALGYNHLLKQLRNDVVILSHVALYNAVYITDGVTCFCYTVSGMSTVKHFAPHVFSQPGATTLAGYVMPETAPDSFMVATLPVDFGMRAAKHIQALEFAVETPTLCEASVMWRNAAGLWRATPWWRLNPAGYVQLPCSGVEFIIRLRGTMDSTFYIAGLMAKIKYEDKRSLRGRYAD